MTQEESDDLNRLSSLKNEYNSLVATYNNAVNRSQNLNSDCLLCQYDIELAHKKVEELKSYVLPKMQKVEMPLQKEVGVTKDLLSLLDEIKDSYLQYKTVGEASKTLTGLYEKYNVRFKNFNELRQVSLAYIVGVDTHIWSSDTPRKMVEQTYLANTTYWLSYAMMAVMLWSSDEKTACERAISKSMQMNEVKSSLFFLLVCLRFERIESAKEWYKIYMGFLNERAITDDMKYILQALLSGSFGSDREFEHQCVDKIRNMLTKLHETIPNIDEQIELEIMRYFDCFVSVTAKEFVLLHRNCAQYESLMKGLSNAEKNQILYDYFDAIFKGKIRDDYRLSNKIEESLYALISGFDDDEKIILDKIKYNDLLVKAMGDKEMAKSVLDNSAEIENKDKNLAIFLCDMALDYDDNTPTIVKKFAMKYMSKYCFVCAEQYGQSYISARQQNYDIEIDGWKCNTDENGFYANKPLLIKHYNKMIKAEAKKDKTIKTSSMTIFASSLIGIFFLALTSISSFLTVGLIVGMLSIGVAGGGIYILCAQWKKIKLANQKLIQYGLKNFAETLEELRLWKNTFDKAHSVNTNLKEMFK